MLSAKDIGRFQEIAKKTLGVELSNEEAYIAAIALVNLMEILLEPASLVEPEIPATENEI